MLVGVVGYVVLVILVLVAVVLLVLAQSGIMTGIPPSVLRNDLVLQSGLAQLTLPFFITVAIAAVLLAAIFVIYYLPTPLAAQWLSWLLIIGITLVIGDLFAIIYAIYVLNQAPSVVRLRNSTNAYGEILAALGLVVVIGLIVGLALYGVRADLTRLPRNGWVVVAPNT